MASHQCMVLVCLCAGAAVRAGPLPLWAVLKEAQLMRQHNQIAGVQAKTDTRNSLLCVWCVWATDGCREQTTHICAAWAMSGCCSVCCAVLYLAVSCDTRRASLQLVSLVLIWVLFCTGLEKGPCSGVGQVAAGWRWFGWLGLPFLLLESGRGGSRCDMSCAARVVCGPDIVPPITIATTRQDP
jgi:hypothetical protein